MNDWSYKAMKPESNNQKVVKYQSSKVFVAFSTFRHYLCFKPLPYP